MSWNRAAVHSLRCQSQCHNRDVIDAASDDQRFRNAGRNAIHVGADLFVHAKNCLIGLGSDDESRRHKHAIIERVGVDVFDAIDGKARAGLRSLNAVGDAV